MATLVSGTVPKGAIVMFSGTIDDDGYPLVDGQPNTDWALCNGAHGTPDLREKFIKSIAAGEQPGDTGGAATHTHDDHPALAHAGAAVDAHASHTHAYTQIVNHTHPVIVTDPTHSHLTQRYPTATGASSGFTIDTSMSGTLADNTLPTKVASTGITAATQNPTGGVASGVTDGPSAALSHAVTQPNDHAVQSHVAASNEPAYFKLAYIMRL